MDFMGPVLWTSDLAVFAEQDPFGLGSHIDMLHDSPLCMGVGWEHDNVYWTVNGESGSIVWYDFGKDHGVGRDDHSDGASLEYVHGQLKRWANVPSHVAFRPEDHMLYIADTGNGRIAKLDTKSGTRGEALPTAEVQLGGYYRMNDASLVDVVPPGTVQHPSGLEIHNQLLFVTDNASGRITAFDLAGNVINFLDTGLTGALAGIAFGPDGKLYFVDMIRNRILRVD
jgi:DNA-binding beta-propeller fold protein YncE